MKEAKEKEEQAWDAQIKDLKAKLEQMEKQKEERAKWHDTAIQQVENMSKQVSDQITSLQPSHLQPATPPPQGPASSTSLVITPTQLHAMGQEVFTSLYSGNPDPSIISSFADMLNLAAIKVGIQGVSFNPVAAKGQECHTGNASSVDAGGGGTKRDSSPSP
eukprot:11779880-Karenia_brevis.AAC.1